MNFFEVIKILSIKVLGYLLFYIEGIEKRKKAFQMLNKPAKEKPVRQHRQQATLFENERQAV